MQGLIVYPGIVDHHHLQEIQVLCSCPQGIFSITSGDRIAQMILLPTGREERTQTHGCNRMGSSGQDAAYLIMPLNNRPTLHLTINGKGFQGIMDTGADKSIISSHWWPRAWPVDKSSHSLQGLGYQSFPTISSTQLEWQTPEGQRDLFTLYVLPLPVNLWGRDVLSEMGLTLTNEYSTQTFKIMSKMGYKNGKCLGKKGAGQTRTCSPPW
ncbi:endogenous retrovirus group K member 6 Pro protein-like [Mus caroli]|uniref:human endogenous retrovirus K endopeptidase n=1 Tax=Mus caroli TaxID=10089 RepID=A0A6P5Q4W6_MUSCR|nr:endogenous retrovirus group K member 6 Pro protein-like [Mus caroli]